jgi:hypothetical protein
MRPKPLMPSLTRPSACAVRVVGEGAGGTVRDDESREGERRNLGAPGEIKGNATAKRDRGPRGEGTTGRHICSPWWRWGAGVRGAEEEKVRGGGTPSAVERRPGAGEHKPAPRPLPPDQPPPRTPPATRLASTYFPSLRRSHQAQRARRCAVRPSNRWQPPRPSDCAIRPRSQRPSTSMNPFPSAAG